MSLENITEDIGDKNLFLDQETSEVSCPLKEFPQSTNVLVVDEDRSTLTDMKKIMEQCTYKVTDYSNAEEAISFLTNRKHEINIVIWDYHTTGIDGLQALAIIGSKMDLPVVIMSKDNKPESVMDALKHGACHYVMKPVSKETLATIWQHIVRKRMISKPGLVPPVEVHDDSSKPEKDDSVTVDQDRGEQNSDKIEEKTTKKRKMTETSNGSDQDGDDSRTVSQDNYEQSIDMKKERPFKKPRISWTGDLQQKFLDAIDICGGPKKANPKALLKCLQDMKIQGLTRNNVSSHLQKYRQTFEEKKSPLQRREPGWSSLRKRSPSIDMNNGFIAPPSLMNGPAVYPVQDNQYQNCFFAPSSLINGPAAYPVQDNQYQNGYMAMKNNQFVTNNMSGFPYLNHDHHLQQQQHPHQQPQYQLANQVNYMMRKNEPEQAYNDLDLTDLESIPPSMLFDPNEFLFDG